MEHRKLESVKKLISNGINKEKFYELCLRLSINHGENQKTEYTNNKDLIDWTIHFNKYIKNFETTQEEVLLFFNHLIKFYDNKIIAKLNDRKSYASQKSYFVSNKRMVDTLFKEEILIFDILEKS